MNFKFLLPTTLFLALAAGQNHAADKESTSNGSDLDGRIPLEKIAIETDHGANLKPEGRDLHFENHLVEPKGDDAELIQQTLEEPTPIKSEVQQDDHATVLSDENPTPEDVVTLDHNVTKRE